MHQVPGVPNLTPQGQVKETKMKLLDRKHEKIKRNNKSGANLYIQFKTPKNVKKPTKQAPCSHSAGI